MSLTTIGLAVLAAAGHVALWVYLLNRWHSLGWPRPVIKTGAKLIELLIAAGPCWLAAELILWRGRSPGWFQPAGALTYYLWLCAALAVGPLAWSLWQRRRWHRAGRPQWEVVLSRRSSLWHLGAVEPSPSLWARTLLRVPLNEALELQTTEKQIVLPRLPPELAGFSIVHLSDLHLSGNIPRRFFEEVVEQANDCRPDLVAITGDILDHARCLSWVESTLGRLRAPYGVYYVLGNHDRRAYAEALRRALDAAGWIGLGGRCLRLRIDRAGVILAGSEWPWFGPRPNMPAAVDDESGPRALRILVAHTPDELAWARRNDFDLVLAGHTHGGQIRLPWVGPVVAPSRHGVRYAAGEFYEPPTAMHVSRGLSGDTAFRFLCPPDLTRIVLVAAPKEQPALPCEDMLQSAGCYLEAVAKPGAS